MPILDQVNAFLNTTKDAREYKRAMAVKLLLLEFEPRDIAELLQVTESFVSKWKKLYFEHGVAVFVIKYHGYQGYLTSEQRQSITERIKTQHIANIDDLIAFIRTTYRIEFKSRQSYYDLFAEAGITWKRAQSQHPDKDLDRIAIKKEIEAVLIQHKDRIASGDMIVYFVDECHVLGDTAVGYGWAPSDQRVTVLVNNNHDRQTYFGALQMLTGAFVLAEYPTANGDTTVAFMHRLRNKHPGKQLLILWDNVSYHYQGDMKEFLIDVNAFLEPDAWIVTCMRFAPYASEQNPIEHVWQIGKQYVRALFHSLRTFSDIKGAFERIKDMRFTFGDLAMYMSTCPENQQAI